MKTKDTVPPINTVPKKPSAEMALLSPSELERKKREAEKIISEARKILDRAAGDKEEIREELESVQTQLDEIAQEFPSGDNDVLSIQQDIKKKKKELEKAFFGKKDKQEEIAQLEAKVDEINRPFKWFVVKKMGRKNFEVLFGSKERSPSAVLRSYIFEENPQGNASEIWDTPEIKDSTDNAVRFSSNGFYIRIKNKNEVIGQKGIEIEDAAAKYDLVSPDGSIVLANTSYAEAIKSLKDHADRYHEEMREEFENEQDRKVSEFREKKRMPLEKKKRGLETELEETKRDEERAENDIEKANAILTSLERMAEFSAVAGQLFSVIKKMEEAVSRGDTKTIEELVNNNAGLYGKFKSFSDVEGFTKIEKEVTSRSKDIEDKLRAVPKTPAPAQTAPEATPEQWTDADQKELEEIDRLLKVDIEQRRKAEVASLPEVVQEQELLRGMIADPKTKAAALDESKELLELLEENPGEYFAKKKRIHSKEQKNRTDRDKIKKYFDDAIKAIKNINKKYDAELKEVEQESA